MGVHGLTGFLKQLGTAHNNDPPISLSHNSSTLAIDGNGLVFHLYRLAYYQHRNNILSSTTQQHYEALQSQLLLPTLLPLKLAHEVTTNYLSHLITKHGLNLRIYFDGPNQYMKSQVRQSRKEQRLDQWDNVRELCTHGILPDGNNVSKFRSSAKKQARKYESQMNNSGSTYDGGDADAELYLASFPLSPLVMDQIERSIKAFLDMSPVLPCGSIQIIQCDGEADSHVAKASADDASGKTFALASDSDYLIYGYPNDMNITEKQTSAKYLQFCQVDSSCDQNDLLVRSVLTRSDVAASLGLPCSSAMVEVSIMMGNDYTSPFVKHDDAFKRLEFWKSLQWCLPGEEDCGDGERLPPESELSWFDIHGIVEHISERVGRGLKLTSDNEELKLAIEFSYVLYTFGDIHSSGFPATAPTTDQSIDDTDFDARIFPYLPYDFDLTSANTSATDMDLIDACLFPLVSYKTKNVGTREAELSYIESRHIDAFRMTLEIMNSVDEDRKRCIGVPKRKMKWCDVQSLFVMEKCLLVAIRETSLIPFQVYDQTIFHSCLESLTLDDFSLDNEIVSKNEKAFLDEVTMKLPSIQEEKKDDSAELILPIDDHKEKILHTVKTQRVTIIRGETGCGKSSRVPCFLLRADPPQPTNIAPEVKMIVSQPRRIAAKSLAERVRSCEPDLADKIALRMGHGLKEHETSKTRCWFVTTGYVVRLLANHPGWFDSHTHLVIDEVHERSVDTDILCLLCRRLLNSHPTIRLVLMSATLVAELYSQYFGSPHEPIHVGVRRYPIHEYFVEDLSELLSLSHKQSQMAKQIHDHCENIKCKAAPTAPFMEKIYKLATSIAASVGDTGSSVLIFVPGMADIEAITELIEGLRVSNVAFICQPIHSDIPFEDQLSVFDAPKKGEVKVIIATNAAESSLTLPDVDHVVCLGLCKQIIYNSASHRQILVPTWISRASATQRAGRTGRVREGSVYRLYSRATYEKYMEPFESGEIVRIPLDQVILSLRDMLGEAVTPILLESLEPPDIRNIERSFESLHEANFLTQPTDDGEITSLGSLVVSLGIDLILGALIGLGIQFGVAPEAIELAAILSFPKSPWAVSSPMYHDTNTFNTLSSKTFVSKNYFDNGLFSEALAIANLLYDYSITGDANRFIYDNGLSKLRIRHLNGSIRSLRQRVAECLSVKVEVLHSKDPPYKMIPAKINILRIIQVWLFHESIIVHTVRKKNMIRHSDKKMSVGIDGPPVNDFHLNQILEPNRHPFELITSGKIVYSVRFDPPFGLLENEADWINDFDTRFASFCIFNEICCSYYSYNGSIKFVLPDIIWEGSECSGLRDAILGKASATIQQQNFYHVSGGNQIGVPDRPCQVWHPCGVESVIPTDDNIPRKRVFVISCLQIGKAKVKEIKSIVDDEVMKASMKSALTCNITMTKKKVIATIEVSGEHQQVSDINDLRDMFKAEDLIATVNRSKTNQEVIFPFTYDDESNQHILVDAPEGARLMAVLASERRRDNFIRFLHDSEDGFIDENLTNKSLIINNSKWKRKNGGGLVFVPVNSVPAAVIPVTDTSSKEIEIFGCCANSLELQGGAMRVDGISLMPPGRLFIGLALLSFGIHPRTGLSTDFVNKEDTSSDDGWESRDGRTFQEALDWIFEKESSKLTLADDWRITAALKFNQSCMDLGEVLECQPDKIKALCAIFDGITGKMEVWNGYDISLSKLSSYLRALPHETKPGTISSDVNEKHQLEKNPKVACTHCNSLFSTWAALRNHCNECCPGSKIRRNRAIALASRIIADTAAHVSDNHERTAEASTYVAQRHNSANKELIIGEDEHQDDLQKLSEELTSQHSNELTVDGHSGSNYDNSKHDDLVSALNNDNQKMTDEYPEEENYACVKCKSIFSTWRKCLSHRNDCCPGMKFKIKNARALASALKAGDTGLKLHDEHSKLGLTCEDCGQHFTGKTQYMDHIAQCLSVNFYCVNCMNTFSEWSSFIGHRNSCGK